jgi:Flp pilus assembly protein TadD
MGAAAGVHPGTECITSLFANRNKIAPMFRRVTAFCLSFGLLAGVAAAGWWWFSPSWQDDIVAVLPLPPFPPRVLEGKDYELCLATLEDDPAGAIAMADALLANGGGDGAAHCQGLALIALGKPEAGAAVLEQLAQRSSAPPMARALVLDQAGQARLMNAQPDQAVTDASMALSLSPDNSELLIMRAAAEGTLERFQDAVADLSHALQVDGGRTDALVSRAVMHRQLNELDLAQADVSRALTLDPDNADALLERGILRQRMGDQAGARIDWEHARDVDPNSTTADLAEQNLSLLDAGPERR